VAPASLIGGQAMADFLKRFTQSGDYDVLVLDGPPLLATTEAAALAPHADEIVLVVGAGMATKRQIGAALDLLGDATDRVSLMLNRAVFPDRAAQYGVYGYGYGQASRHGPAGKS
jgi:Mrp family chromosome partitioning ATPase